MTLDNGTVKQLGQLSWKVARQYDIDPSELVQQTALTILRRDLLAKWNPTRSSLTTYLHIILRSTASTMRRTARRRSRTLALYLVHQRAQRLTRDDLERRSRCGTSLDSLCRESAPLLSPVARNLFEALLKGQTRTSVQNLIGGEAERHAYREIVEVLECRS